MATVKKSKAKNLSAGPSKKTTKARPVDPKGQYTKVQERTLGKMKKGGKITKAQNGITDSTAYYNNFAKHMATKSKQAENKGDTATSNMYMDVMLKASEASQRQKHKGKPGYDKMGNPIKKSMKIGGKVLKYQTGRTPIKPSGSQGNTGTSPVSKLPYKPTKIKETIGGMRDQWSKREKEMTTKKPTSNATVLYKKGGKLKKK
jgi:hypothetical protein